MRHYGFYDDLDDIRSPEYGDCPNADFSFMENERGIDGMSPYDFLHGYCDVFAVYLHRMYGFGLEKIVDGNGKLVHAYCKSIANGKPVFIDIRGETDDYREFISEFDDFLEYINDPVYPLPGTSSFCVQEVEPDEKIYAAARWMDEWYKYWD